MYMRFKLLVHDKAGFTLIEGIIATGIIGTALVVGLSLAIANLSAAQTNSDRILAGQLAREGIEVVRNMRDSNWLRREASIDIDGTGAVEFYTWDDIFEGWPILNTGACGGDCYGNYFDVILTDPDLATSGYKYTLKKVTANPADVLLCIGDAGQPSCRVYERSGVYHQKSSEPTSEDRATFYYRRIILNPICWDATAETEVVESTVDMLCNEVAGHTEKIGMLVTSHVVWQRSTKTLEVRIKERMYNWRTP